MDVFTPAVAPSMNGTEITVTPRLITNTFGDGYKQSAPDGLNVGPLSASLVWASLTQTDAQNIISFFTSHIGVTFYYTLPNETTAREWQVDSWKYGFLAGDVMTVSAQFDERFDLI